MSKTLLVMAGGTGGHIFPGIAVAEALRLRGWRIVWMGNADRMEGRLIPDQGYETAWIKFGAVRGKGLLPKLLLPLNLLRGFWQALGALQKVKPDVVLGMGGYVTFPGGMMAVLLGKPLVLHEQNSIAGLANRVLSRVADCTLTGFPGALSDGQWVGNPVRSDIAAVPEPALRYGQREGRLRVLVVGGSLGASILNEVVPAALARLPEASRPIVTHQAGVNQFDALQQAYARAGVQGELLPFIDNMAERYAEADLVICRSGALTVAELAAVGVASILVPFPHAVDDHQTANARFLSNSAAARLLPQPEFTAESLSQVLTGLDRGVLLEMASKARALGRVDASAQVADICAAYALGSQA